MLRRVWSWTCAFQKRVPANKTLIELIKRFAPNFFISRIFFCGQKMNQKMFQKFSAFLFPLKIHFREKAATYISSFCSISCSGRRRKKLRKTERFGKVRQKISADKERQRTEWIILGGKKSPPGKWRWWRNQLKTIFGSISLFQPRDSEEIRRRDSNSCFLDSSHSVDH